MTCERHYTAATVAELQRIALLVELRKRIATRRRSLNPRDYANAYYSIMLSEFEQWLDELSPVCDNPPNSEAVSLADYAEGMRP